MTKYADIYDAGISATERKQLVRQVPQEPWFKAMPKAEQEHFMIAIKRMEKEAVTNIRKETLLYATYPILQDYMAKEMSVGTQRLLALYHAFFTKGNMAMMALLTFGVVSTYASNQRIQDTQLAKRICNDFTLFLKATPEELAKIQKNQTDYQTCARNAAMLHELTQYSDEELNSLTNQVRHMTLRQQLHPASVLAR